MLPRFSMHTYRTNLSPIISIRGNSKWDTFLTSCLLQHSAKGSTWEEHKYIKRIDGTYYYPDDYEGGRHLPDSEKNRGSDQVDIDSLSESDVQKLAMEGIRGNFGNGQERKEALGSHYQQVQDRINSVLRGEIPMDSTAAKKIGKEATDNAVKKLATGGIDLDTVYAVYNKKGNGIKKASSSSKKTSSNSTKAKGSKRDQQRSTVR